MSYQVLARKWRPANFHELVGQQHVKKALITALDGERLHHAYLFTGTRGVGKTTIARILSKCLNCVEGISSTPCGNCSSCNAIAEGRFVDLIEVDAASRTKVEDTRDMLDNVQYRPTEGRYKVYLIDEVHMLSTHSFNALLKTLEEPPPHVIFLLATTDPQKLPVTVLSRCLQFHLRHMSEDEISNHLGFILGKEQIEFETKALELIAAASDGSMRDGLSLLDQAIAHGGGSVKDVSVREMLGTVERAPIWGLIESIYTKDDAAVFEGINKFSEFSSDFEPVLDEMLHALHELALAQKLESIDNQLLPQAKSLSKLLKPEDIQLYYQIALHGKRDLPLASSSRMGFEMTMLRLMAFQVEANSPAQKKTKKIELEQTPEKKSNTDAVVDSPKQLETQEQQTKPSEEIQVVKKTIPEQPPVERKTIESPPWEHQSTNQVIAESEANKTELKPDEKISVSAEPAVTIPSIEVTADNWAQITTSLELDGMSRQMMINSKFISKTEQELVLSCFNLLPQALTSERVKKITQAVSGTLGYNISVRIEAEIDSPGKGESAMEVKQRETSERLVKAKRDFENDSLVKEILNKFDGTILEDSIKPLTE